MTISEGCGTVRKQGVKCYQPIWLRRDSIKMTVDEELRFTAVVQLPVYGGIVKKRYPWVTIAVLMEVRVL